MASRLPLSRTNYEQLALRPFHALLSQYGRQASHGQGLTNRLLLPDGSYLQFGDLRVDFPDHWLIVEVESGGGVTNLVKYWYCLEHNLITRPITLLHLFRQTSTNDYRSHLHVWDFCAAQMHKALGERFAGHRFRYQSQDDDGLQAALQAFEAILAQHRS